MSAVANQTPWISVFQGLFHAFTDQWKVTLAAWAEQFHAEGRSNSELVFAVQAVSKRNPLPKFPLDLYEALREELKIQDRCVQGRNQAENAKALGWRPYRCGTCCDSGWIVGLPHPESVRGPEWIAPRRTCAVTCHCAKGAQVNAAWAMRPGEPKHIWDWSTYAQRNPSYQAQLEAAQIERQAIVTTHEHQHGDFEWRQTVERILERMKQNGGGHDPA